MPAKKTLIWTLPVWMLVEKDRFGGCARGCKVFDCCCGAGTSACTLPGGCRSGSTTVSCKS